MTDLFPWACGIVLGWVARWTYEVWRDTRWERHRRQSDRLEVRKGQLRMYVRDTVYRWDAETGIWRKDKDLSA